MPTVYIVDDDIILVKAIAWLLESVELKVITYTSSLDFLAAYRSEWRGCILLDIRMPQMSGLELQEKLATKHNQLPILMMSGHGDIPMAVRAMKAGALDFIVKPFNDQHLLELVQKALQWSETHYSNKQQLSLISRCYASLTARERQVMSYVINGKLNKQIAGELEISLSTVELHRAHVMQKMKADSLAQLVKMHLLLQEEGST